MRMRIFSFMSSKLEIYWVKWEIPFLPQVKNDLNMFSAHLFEQHHKLVYEKKLQYLETGEVEFGINIINKKLELSK